MANVHGFRDLNNNGDNPNQGQQPYRNLDQPMADNIPFLNPLRGDQRPPMQETIPYTLKTLCCPDLRVFSTTTLFLLAIWVVYVVCLTQGVSRENNQVLEVEAGVLVDFGAASGVLIREGQVYRLVTASFLHVNLLHILMNSISLLILLTRFEKIYPCWTPVVLLAASITGFMLSVLCNRTDLTVGASTAIFGVLGALVAYLVINWGALEKYGPVRSTLACIVGVILVFSLLFSIGSNIDIVAHLGGLLGGLFAGLAFLPGLEAKNKVLQWVGLGCLGGMNLLTFLLFFCTD